MATKKTKLAQRPLNREGHPANLANQYEDGTFYHIDIDVIQPDPEQPRKYFNQQALEELADSIRLKGVLQPVIIRRDQEGNTILVAGERRWRASKIAGLTQMPAILKTKENALEISLIENLQRQNLNSIEEAEALQRMINEHGYSQVRLAKSLGKARTTVNEILTLNRLPEEVKEGCRHADTYTLRLLVEIAKQESPEAMIELFKRAKDNNLNSASIRTITRKYTEKPTRSLGEIVADKLVNLATYLKRVQIDTLEFEEKSRVLIELHNLKKTIEDLIN